MSSPQPTLPTANALKPQEFIDKFITPTISDYKKRSEGAKRKWQWYHLSQYFFVLLTPIVGAILPIFGWGSGLELHAATGISGFVAAYLTYVLTSGKYQLNYVQYDATYAALKVQYVLFSAGAKPYDTPDSCKVFATNFEKIVSDEVQHWAQEMLGSASPAGEQGRADA